MTTHHAKTIDQVSAEISRLLEKIHTRQSLAEYINVKQVGQRPMLCQYVALIRERCDELDELIIKQARAAD